MDETLNTAHHACRALFISAPASGQGKTTVTAALARYYVRQGLRVRVFKTGPDFLDPMVLAHASGSAVYQLDLWMGGENHCRELLFNAAKEAEIILVEGVMGLFDGEPSGADLAALFNIPILAVIDATAMAQTFGALAYGLANYRPGLKFSGVLANRVASTGHAEMLRESLPKNISWYGALMRDQQFALPSRHLGLMQASEIHDIESRIEKAAEALAQTANMELPPLVQFSPNDVPRLAFKTSLSGVRIAVAKDQAFSFIYRANIAVLEEMGAEINYFSPLNDSHLPDADSLYIPGGYPELHLNQLGENETMKQSIRAHHSAGKPIVAECGGMMYLFRWLVSETEQTAEMVGILPGKATMMPKLVNLGLHQAELPEGMIKGHTFHHSQSETNLIPITHTSGRRGKPEPVFRLGRLHASYLHLYFPSNPDACASLFAK